MARLADAHIEQIKKMREDGKTLKDIKEYFKATYNIKLYDGKICAITKGIAKKPQNPEGGVKPKRHYKKRGVKGVESGALTPDNAIKDIITLLAEIQNGYKQVFVFLRKELMRSRAEVCEMLSGAGLNAPESSIQE